MAYHYYSETQENLKSDPNTYTFFFRNNKLLFTSDIGSYTLIDTFIPNSTKKSLLDVGCGYGPIGITIAKLYPYLNIKMIDINERAISLAKKNVEQNKAQNVTVLKSNIYENIKEEESFDYILTNPPIRAGKKVIYEIYDGAIKHLNQNGELWVVIQKKQGAPSTIDHLNAIFGNCEIVTKEKGYFILKSVYRGLDK